MATVTTLCIEQLLIGDITITMSVLATRLRFRIPSRVFYRNNVVSTQSYRFQHVFGYKSKLVRTGFIGSRRVFSVQIPDEADTRPEYMLDDDAFINAVNNEDIYVIDVRTPRETENGRIEAKQWINIPFNEVSDAFSLRNDEFKEEFGLDKPGKDDKLVFYCIAGLRSTVALNAALWLGYSNAKHYPGGMANWTKYKEEKK